MVFCMPNKINGVLNIVLSPEGEVRPVVSVRDGISYQLRHYGDIILFKHPEISELCYTKQLSRNAKPVSGLISELENDDKFKTDFVLKYFKKKNPKVGLLKNSIETLSRDYQLNRFFTGFQNDYLLEGLVNVRPILNLPYYGKFNINDLVSTYDVNVLDGLVNNYEEYDNLIPNDYVTNRLSKEKYIINMGTNLPKKASVAVLMKNNNPIRFNDVILFKNDGSTVIVKGRSVSNSFGNKDRNFIMLPFEITNEVTRMMYILHDIALGSQPYTIAWLFNRSRKSKR